MIELCEWKYADHTPCLEYAFAKPENSWLCNRHYGMFIWRNEPISEAFIRSNNVEH